MYIYNLEESTVHQSTTTGPIPVKSTQGIYKQQSTAIRETTLELDKMTTERSTLITTSANLPTKISTLFAKEEIVTQSDSLSKSMKSEKHHDDLSCGIFCVGQYASHQKHIQIITNKTNK